MSRPRQNDMTQKPVQVDEEQASDCRGLSTTASEVGGTFRQTGDFRGCVGPFFPG